MNWKDKVGKIKLNSINISFDKSKSKSLPIGVSKLGGRPDLPKGFQWYYFKWEDLFSHEVKNGPLSFLAQINCEEIKEYDVDNRLPNTGILYFFYELESMAWGSGLEDKGSARVYYYDGDISELIRTDLPKDMPKNFKIPEAKFSFSAEYNVPYFEEMSDNYDSDLWDEYNDFLEKAGYKTSRENSTKLLGYSDNIQGDMILQCELATNGINCDINGYKSEKIKELEKNKNQWKLLFQLDSIIIDDFQLMFGDCGRIYYYIKEEDLMSKSFNKIWLVLQCG